MTNMYNFKIKLNKNDLFLSSLNYNRNSKTFFFDIIFTCLAWFATLYTLFNKTFFSFEVTKRVLLLLCCVLFPVVQPILLYIKSAIRAKKIKDYEIELTFDDTKVVVASKEEKREVLYENIYNLIKYKNMIVLMYDSIHGQIIPDRLFDNNKEEFFIYLSEKINNARKRQKENNK